MTKTRKFHQVGWSRLWLAFIPSWEWAGVERKYGRWSVWSNDGGVSLRWRGYVLRIGR